MMCHYIHKALGFPEGPLWSCSSHLWGDLQFHEGYSCVTCSVHAKCFWAQCAVVLCKCSVFSHSTWAEVLGTMEETHPEISRQTVMLWAQIGRKMMMMTLLLEILREADPDMQRSVCVLDALLLLTININERSVWIYLCLSKKLNL